MTTAAIRPRPSAAGSSQPDLAVTAYRLADIGVVRRRLTEALRMCECVEPLIDTAVLLATELLGNALRHAAPGGRPLVVRLDMHWNGRGLTLAVSDPDPRVPAARTAAPDAESGRGLELLEALAARWGTRPTATGKTVWCVIS